MKSKATSATENEEEDIEKTRCLEPVNIPNFVERNFNACVDAVIILFTYELWGCCDETEKEAVQTRDEDTDRDDGTTCTDRDDDTYRTDDGYPDYVDDESYFTQEDESLYSRYDDESLYSRYARYTNAEEESVYSRDSYTRNANAGEEDAEKEGAGEEDDQAINKEEEKRDEGNTDFEKIIFALKRHAASLGISDMELLQRLEAQQDAIRKEEQSLAQSAQQRPVLETVEEGSEDATEEGSETTVLTVVLEKEESRKEESGKGREIGTQNVELTLQPKQKTLSRKLGLRPRKFNNNARRKRRPMFRRVNVVP